MNPSQLSLFNHSLESREGFTFLRLQELPTRQNATIGHRKKEKTKQKSSNIVDNHDSEGSSLYHCANFEKKQFVHQFPKVFMTL